MSRLPSPTLPPTTTAAYKWIATTVLAAPAASISFAGLDTTNRFFEMPGYVVNDANAKSLWVRFNGDSTSTLYSYQGINASAGAVAGARTTGANQIVLSADTLDASVWQQFTARITKPVAGVAAQVLLQSAYDPAASIKLDLDGAQWANVADLLSDIELLASANNFDTGTSISLFGADRA